MADNEPEAAEGDPGDINHKPGDAAIDNTDGAPDRDRTATEAPPVKVSDLREAVDEKLDDLFGGIDEDEDVIGADGLEDDTPLLTGGAAADQEPAATIIVPPPPMATPDPAAVFMSPKTPAPNKAQSVKPRANSTAPKADTEPPPATTSKKVTAATVKKAAPPKPPAAPETAQKPNLNISQPVAPAPKKVTGDHRRAGNARPPKAKAPSPTTGRPKATPQLGRIMLWGSVLGFVVCTVMYFKTYQSEAPATSTAESGILFHKIAPLEPPAAVQTPTPSGAVASKAATDKKPAAVAAYVERLYPYSIHMASYRDPELARKMAAEYGRGFQAFLVRTDLGEKGIWYRLHFGHFPDAISASDAVKKYHLKDALVGHTRYACLVGSYPSAALADAASRRLTQKGYFPYTIVAGNGHHVFVGANPTRPAAEDLSKDLEKNGFPNKVINK
ncbi:MAG: SPOR domain-containing protein [Pseudomonadota bacterium]